MINISELDVLLREKSKLQTEFNNFLGASARWSSYRLLAQIDNLINVINLQLREPSDNEDDSVKLYITNLGQILKNLNDIKTHFKTNSKISYKLFQQVYDKDFFIKLNDLWKGLSANFNKAEHFKNYNDNENSSSITLNY